MFENINPQGSLNTSFGSESSAVLWIFTPRRYSNQAHRPTVYNFDHQFMDEATRVLETAAHTSNMTEIEGLSRNPYFLSHAIVPSFQPDHVLDMSQLSQFYSFMLIVNNDKMSPDGTMVRRADCQHLYYGVFLDEPVNPIHHMGQVTINPQATMLITHRTLINRTASYGQAGQQTQLHMMGDFDVVHPKPVTFYNTDREHGNLHLLRPQDLLENVATDLGGAQMIFESPHTTLGAQEGPVQVSTRLGMPQEQIKRSLGAVAHAHQSMNAKSFQDSSAIILGKDSFDMMVSQNVRDMAALQETGRLRINQRISLGQVIQTYNAQYHVARQAQDAPYDPIDQVAGMDRNVFASMLAHVVPAMMAEFMLSDIAFAYHSPHNAIKMLDGGFGMQQASFGSLTPMGQTELERRVRGFFYRLQTEVFPFLVNARGHFDLSMKCSQLGVTNILLNFLDNMTRTPEVYEVPTILGGFNTPLIGRFNIFEGNARELNNLITTTGIADTDLPPKNYNFLDQQRYQRSLTQSDSQAPTQPQQVPGNMMFDPAKLDQGGPPSSGSPFPPFPFPPYR